MAAKLLKVLKSPLVSLLFFGLFAVLPAHAEEQHPLSAVAKVTPYAVEPEQIAELQVSVLLPIEFKAYEDQFHIQITSPEGVKISKFSISPLTEFFDTFTKKKRRGVMGSATLIAPFELPKNMPQGDQILDVKLTYQACTKAYCLFPQNVMLKVPVTVNAPVHTLHAKSFFKMSFEEIATHGLWISFIFVFLFGVLSSFTPCVYPMIPITIAVLGREAHARTRWQNFKVSLTYVCGIAATYSALGVVAASTGMLFGSFISHPLVLGFVVVVFLLMALSMFGLFELQAPPFLRDTLLSHLHVHGYLGAFVSGLVAGIVASPCVGPVLVGILTFVAQTQNLWLGFWLLFVYALGMGMLFLALGVFSHFTKALPRSGEWMARIKIFFGMVMVAMAIYYLNMIFPVTHLFDQSRWISDSPGVSERAMRQWNNYSDELLQKAQTEGRPVIIDFRADWCAACKELEQFTFSSSKFKKAAKDFELLKFDATNDSPALEKMKERYHIVGLPWVIFISKSGKWQADLTLTAYEDVDPVLVRIEKTRQAP
jgi:thiol:disulfide interchange protein DsbD